MLKIGLISAHTSPLAQPGSGDSGGLNVYVQQLAHALAHQGNECLVFARKTSPTQPQQLEIEPGVKIIHLEAGDYDLKLDELPSMLEEFTDSLAKHLIESEAIDIFHANYWLSAVAAHTLKHELNLPLVTTFHTLGRVKAKHGEDITAERIEAEARVINCSEVLTASCSAEAQELIQFYDADPDRIKLIAPGVDHAFFSPGNQLEAQRALGIDSTKPTLLYVGRIQSFKRFSLAVETLAALQETCDANLVAVGGPSGSEGNTALSESLELASSLGIRHKIRMVKPLPHHLLSTYYRAADLVLVPSKSESFGLVALEAAACGVPVVATNVGGLSTLIDHQVTGLLVDDSTPEAFAAAAEEILTDRIKSAEMALDAVARASFYKWPQAAAKLSEQYLKSRTAALLDC